MAHNAGVITEDEFAVFQNAGYMGLYGGEGFDGVPQIMNADSDKICKLTIKPGEGKYIVPLI